MKDWNVNPAAPDMTSSDSDWDALVETGRLNPELALTDPEQVKAVWAAVDLLRSFFNTIREAGIREEC